MSDLLSDIVSKIAELNPIHGKKLRKTLLDNNDDMYVKRVNVFLDKYIKFLKSQNKDIDFGVNCYLKMTSDFTYEHIRFLETGEYSVNSFEDVEKRVYGNPEIMEYYINGVLLSQILWKHHYSMFAFFSDSFPKYKKNIKAYLEVGGGHGLFISEAIKCMDNKNINLHFIDVSNTSINVAKKFICNESVKFINANILDFNPENKFDFITMGEVLEHVEQPLALLKKLMELLNRDGHIFITTPTNAPAIDHIYLFNNFDEVRDLIKEAGFRIIEETSVFAENVPKEIIEEMKVTGMYGAFLSK
jgi:2-polyprenyl-3-methyl-5-hydroxy-6-metoxy-1,4-benzoquinol methylase